MLYFHLSNFLKMRILENSQKKPAFIFSSVFQCCAISEICTSRSFLGMGIFELMPQLNFI